jgi:hypothetical protein
MEPTRIYDAALSLADDERADLAYKLLQSLTRAKPATHKESQTSVYGAQKLWCKTLKPPSILSADTPELEDEVERRIAAYGAGEASADDWDNTSARLRRALQDKRAK